MSKETEQFIDSSDLKKSLGLEFHAPANPEQVITNISNLPEARALETDDRHRFLKTPDALIFGEKEKQQLQEIGQISFTILSTTANWYSEILNNTSPFPPEAKRYLQSALESCLCNQQRNRQKVNPSLISPFFRVDCVINDHGDLVASEIEAARTIGLGFAVFTQAVRNEVHSDEREGLAEALEEELYSFSQEKPIVHILGEDQLFYLPEQELVCQEMRARGIRISIVREKDCQITQSGIFIPDWEIYTDRVLCLPVFNPTESNKSIDLGFLAKLYNDGLVKFLIPPNSFLGTKAIYGLIHHPFFRKFYAWRLREFGFSPEVIDHYFPRSCLITGDVFEAERLLLEMEGAPAAPAIIKAVGLSAARGIAFPHEKDEIQHLLKVAKGKPFHYLVQEFIPQNPFQFRVSNGNSIATKDQFLRLSPHFRVRGNQVELVEVSGTGLGSPLATAERPVVHGNPECILFPVVLK